MPPQRTIHIVGKDEEPTFKRLSVLDVEGEFLFELTPYGESTLRQERRAEATQLAQVLLQSLPLGAATGTPLSYEVLITEFLKSWGEDNPKKYFTRSLLRWELRLPHRIGALSGGQQPAPPGQGQNLGTTAASAVDASAPSATGGLGMSGQQMNQRALAASSGPRNA
jgi:hypothetical protein